MTEPQRASYERMRQIADDHTNSPHDALDQWIEAKVDRGTISRISTERAEEALSSLLPGVTELTSDVLIRWMTVAWVDGFMSGARLVEEGPDGRSEEG